MPSAYVHEVHGNGVMGFGVEGVRLRAHNGTRRPAGRGGMFVSLESRFREARARRQSNEVSTSDTKSALKRVACAEPTCWRPRRSRLYALLGPEQIRKRTFWGIFPSRLFDIEKRGRRCRSGMLACCSALAADRSSRVMTTYHGIADRN